MKLYLIRHSKPIVDQYSGFPGVGLGIQGMREADLIFEILKTREIDTIYLSDYNRVLETALPTLSHFKSSNCVMSEDIRGREKDEETLDSHVKRVKRWLNDNKGNFLLKNSAVFSHCGTLNIIQFYLERLGEIQDSEFVDELHRHTPFAGIWELELTQSSVLHQRMIFSGDSQ